MTSPFVGRSPRSEFLRPAATLFVAFSAIVAMGIWRVTPRIELALERDVETHALVDLPEVRVHFDGRDATLRGSVADARERAAVIAAVQSRWGVRTVQADALVAQSSAGVETPWNATAATGGTPGLGGLAGATTQVEPPKTEAPAASTTKAATTTTVAATTTTTSTTTTTISPAVFDGLDATMAGMLKATPIRFAKSASTPDRASGNVLDRVAGVIKSSPGPVIRVESHTDSSGSTEANLLLSEKRALALLDALVARGVPAERLVAEGLGESVPIAPDATEAGRQRNRRVEIRTVR